VIPVWFQNGIPRRELPSPRTPSPPMIHQLMVDLQLISY